MHRSKLGARRISASPDNSTPPPSNHQQQQQFPADTSEASWQASRAVDYQTGAGLKLYNPNDIDGRTLGQQQFNTAVQYQQQQSQQQQQQAQLVSWGSRPDAQNAFGHYQHYQQPQQQQQQQQWNQWSSGAITSSYYGWDSTSNVPTSVAQQSQYVQQSQSQPSLHSQSQSTTTHENSWESQPNNAVLHRNFSDTWNWGSGDESPDVSVSSQQSNAGSGSSINHVQPSANQFADVGHTEQWQAAYQTYDGAAYQQVKAQGYDWSGSSNPTTTETHILDSYNNYEHNYSSTSQAFDNVRNGGIEPVVTNDWPSQSSAHNSANVNPEIRPPSSRSVADESSANELLVSEGDSAMSAFFQNDQVENRPQEACEIEQSRAEMSAEVSSANNNDYESLFAGAHPIRAPYLRGDSCISNSSLMTFNPSTVGSVEELPSGSFCGDDGGFAMSIGNLAESVENLHLNVHRNHRSQRHPLNQSFPGPLKAVLDSSGDMSEITESLPLFADRNAIMGGLDPSHLNRRRSSVPNALISNNQENPDSGAEEAINSSTAAGVEDSSCNVEVPPITEDAAKPDTGLNVSGAERIVEKSADDKNVEVVDASGKPVGPSPASFTTPVMWSRENSAFQPVSPSKASTSEPVIQQELSNNNNQTIEAPKSGCTVEAVNLETVPDNVEYPLDSQALVEPPAPNKSTLHLIVSARQHAREMRASSPSAPLWDNPELPRGFDMVVPPATSLQPAKQSAIIVPLSSIQRTTSNQSLSVSADQQRRPSPSISAPETSKTKPEPLKVAQYPEVIEAADRRKEVSGGPLDLSSRTTRQTPSLRESDTPPSRNAAGPFSVAPASTQKQPAYENRSEHIPSAHHQEEGFRPNAQPPPPNADQSERQSHGEQWTAGNRYEAPRPMDDRRGRRFSVDSRDDGSYDHRQTHDGRYRGNERPGREWDGGGGYYGGYDHQRERERSRPSSRSSSHDYDGQGADQGRQYDGQGADQGRHYYDHRRPYPLPSDSSGRQRPPSVGPTGSGGGYESDQEAHERRRRYPDYNYYNHPQYAAYEEYFRYSRDPRYDPRQLQRPNYYDTNSYNYGYYQELYGNDPRYKAYYESLAKNYYGAVPYAYAVDYDRRSTHSGRSSVSHDGSQRASGEAAYTDAFHRESPISQNVPAQNVPWEQSTIYPPGDSLSYVEGVAVDQQSTQDFTNQRLTPAKFATPHLRATFGPSGHFVIVLPNSIVDGHSAQVEISDVHNLLADDLATKELQAFPGPLVRCDTHKNDVIQFCMQKVRQLRKEVLVDVLPDRDSCALIWELLVLLVRQNGVVVGSDIAELLLHNHKTSIEVSQPFDDALVEDGESPSSPDEGVVITNDFSATNLAVQSSVEEVVTKKFRDYLLFGHKKDALEWAMKHGLWGHALFLASKMDNRTYAMVMTRFANSLALNDPLQSLYQLMSGRQPAAVTRVADEKWGDWRPHLAMILSNSSTRPDLDRRSVVTLGDTLAARGCLHAAHFCYLMAQVDFGNYDKKSSKLVLIGSNHGLPFSRFATNEAIQCTEIYEYVQSLASPQFALPSLQAYKYIYATRLAECGQLQEALHYAEVVTQTIRAMPSQFSLELVRRVHQLAYRLKYYDPYYHQEEMGDPVWLQELGAILQAYLEGTVHEYTESADESQVDSSLDYTSNVNQVGAYQDTQQQPYTAREEPEMHQQQLSTDASQHYSDYGVSDQQPVAYRDGEQQQQESHQIVDGPLTSGQQYYDGAPGDQYVGNSYGLTEESNRSDLAPPASERGIPAQTSRRASTDYYGASTYADSEAVSYSGGGENTTAASTNVLSSSSPPGRKPSYTSASNRLSAPPSKATEHAGAKRSSVSNKTSKGNIGAAGPKQSSWLGGIFSRFSLLPKNQMNLPDDKNPRIVWDSVSGQWLNTDGDDETDSAGPMAPPKDLELPPGPAAKTEIPLDKSVQHSSPSSPPFGNQLPLTSPGQPTTATATTTNRFKLRQGRGIRQNYVDILKDNTVSVGTPVRPVDGSPLSTAPQMPTQYFIPAPISAETNSGAIDFVTPVVRVGNPSSQGGSPHQSDNESDNTNQNEVGGGQPFMYDPSSVTHKISSSTTPTTQTAQNNYQAAGLQKKYGTRYPR